MGGMKKKGPTTPTGKPRLAFREDQRDDMGEKTFREKRTKTGRVKRKGGAPSLLGKKKKRPIGRGPGEQSGP